MVAAGGILSRKDSPILVIIKHEIKVSCITQDLTYSIGQLPKKDGSPTPRQS